MDEPIETPAPVEEVPTETAKLRKDGKVDGRSLRYQRSKSVEPPQDPDPAKTAALSEDEFLQVSKYRPEFCQKILEYFDQPNTKEVKVVIQTRGGGTLTKTENQGVPPRQMSAFARSVGVTGHETLVRWAAKYPEFKRAYKQAKDMIREQILESGTMGHWNAQFTKLYAVNETDMRDKTAVDVTSENRALAPTITITPREIPPTPPAKKQEGSE